MDVIAEQIKTTSHAKNSCEPEGLEKQEAVCVERNVKEDWHQHNASKREAHSRSAKYAQQPKDANKHIAEKLKSNGP
jgi:hypothetical protein